MNRRMPGAAILALVLIAAVAGIWLFGVPFADGNFKTVLMVGALVAACGVAGKTLSDWRKGVYLFLVWVLFEDLIRKYMGNSMVVYFFKDLLVAVAYIAFLMARYRGDVKERFHPPFKYALGMFVLLGVAQVFNSGSPSFWYGIMGMKLYFYYVPLMFLGYALLRDETELRRFLFLNAGLAAIISVVGILQSILGLQFLNPRGSQDIDLLSHLVRATPSGGLVSRPPSVFVSDSRFGWYLVMIMPLLLGAAGYLLLQRTKRGRKLVFSALGLTAVGAMVTGSRGTFVWVAISAVIIPVVMIWGAPPKLAEGYRMIKAIRRTAIVVAFALVSLAVLFPTVLGTRWEYYRDTMSPFSSHSELALRVWDYPLSNLTWVVDDPDWLIGHGIGTASLGAQYVPKIMGAQATTLFAENGIATLIIELGILGPICWLVWATALMLEVRKAVMSLKGTWAFPIGLSILWYAVFLLFETFWGGINAYQNFVNNAYFWLFIGVLFRLPSLVEQQQHACVEAPTEVYPRATRLAVHQAY